MNAVNPVTAQQELRLKIPADAKGDISVFLAATMEKRWCYGGRVALVRPRVMLKISRPFRWRPCPVWCSADCCN